MLDAGGTQRALGGGPEIEMRVAANDVLSERLAERPRDLFADLVTARPDARPDRRSDPAGAEHTHARADDPGEEAAPAGVQDADRRTIGVRSRKCDRHAVRRQQQHRATGLVAP